MTQSPFSPNARPRQGLFDLLNLWILTLIVPAFVWGQGCPTELLRTSEAALSTDQVQEIFERGTDSLALLLDRTPRALAQTMSQFSPSELSELIRAYPLVYAEFQAWRERLDAIGNPPTPALSTDDRADTWTGPLLGRSLDRAPTRPLAAYLSQNGRASGNRVPLFGGLLEKAHHAWVSSPWIPRHHDPLLWSPILSALENLKTGQCDTLLFTGTEEARKKCFAAVWSLYGSLTEGWFLEPQEGLIPGDAIRVAGKKHADGWKTHLEGDRLVIDGFVEVKASIVGFHHSGRYQIHGFLDRLVSRNSTVEIYGYAVPREKIYVRTRNGAVPLDILRQQISGPMLEPARLGFSANGVPAISFDGRWPAFARGFEAHFPADFYEVRLPKDELAYVRLDLSAADDALVGLQHAGPYTLAENRDRFIAFLGAAFPALAADPGDLRQLLFTKEIWQRSVLLRVQLNPSPSVPFPTQELAQPERVFETNLNKLLADGPHFHVGYARLAENRHQSKRRFLERFFYPYAGIRALTTKPAQYRAISVENQAVVIEASDSSRSIRFEWSPSRTEPEREYREGSLVIHLPEGFEFASPSEAARWFDTELIGHDLHRYTLDMAKEAELNALGIAPVVLKEGQKREIEAITRLAKTSQNGGFASRFVIAPTAYGKTLLLTEALKSAIDLEHAAPRERPLAFIISDNKEKVAEVTAELLKNRVEAHQAFIHLPWEDSEARKETATLSDLLLNALDQSQHGTATVISVNWDHLKHRLRNADAGEIELLQSMVRFIFIDEARELSFKPKIDDDPWANPKVLELLMGDRTGKLLCGFDAFSPNARELDQFFGGQVASVYPNSLAGMNPAEIAVHQNAIAIQRGEVTPLREQQDHRVMIHRTAAEATIDANTPGAVALPRANALYQTIADSELRQQLYQPLTQTLSAFLRRRRGVIRVTNQKQADDFAAFLSAALPDRRFIQLHGSTPNSAGVYQRLMQADGPQAIDWVVTNRLFDRGIEISHFDGLVLIGETLDSEVFLQLLGNIFGLAPGKTEAEVFQISEKPSVSDQLIKALLRKRTHVELAQTPATAPEIAVKGKPPTTAPEDPIPPAVAEVVPTSTSAKTRAVEDKSLVPVFANGVGHREPWDENKRKAVKLWFSHLLYIVEGLPLLNDDEAPEKRRSLGRARWIELDALTKNAVNLFSRTNPLLREIIDIRSQIFRLLDISDEKNIAEAFVRLLGGTLQVLVPDSGEALQQYREAAQRVTTGGEMAHGDYPWRLQPTIKLGLQAAYSPFFARPRALQQLAEKTSVPDTLVDELEQVEAWSGPGSSYITPRVILEEEYIKLENHFRIHPNFKHLFLPTLDARQTRHLVESIAFLQLPSIVAGTPEAYPADSSKLKMTTLLETNRLLGIEHPLLGLIQKRIDTDLEQKQELYKQIIDVGVQKLHSLLVACRREAKVKEDSSYEKTQRIYVELAGYFHSHYLAYKKELERIEEGTIPADNGEIRQALLRIVWLTSDKYFEAVGQRANRDQGPNALFMEVWNELWRHELSDTLTLLRVLHGETFSKTLTAITDPVYALFPISKDLAELKTRSAKLIEALRIRWPMIDSIERYIRRTDLTPLAGPPSRYVANIEGGGSANLLPEIHRLFSEPLLTLDLERSVPDDLLADFAPRARALFFFSRASELTREEILLSGPEPEQIGLVCWRERQAREALRLRLQEFRSSQALTTERSPATAAMIVQLDGYFKILAQSGPTGKIVENTYYDEFRANLPSGDLEPMLRKTEQLLSDADSYFNALLAHAPEPTNEELLPSKHSHYVTQNPWTTEETTKIQTWLAEAWNLASLPALLPVNVSQAPERLAGLRTGLLLRTDELLEAGCKIFGCFNPLVTAVLHAKNSIRLVTKEGFTLASMLVPLIKLGDTLDFLLPSFSQWSLGPTVTPMSENPLFDEGFDLTILSKEMFLTAGGFPALKEVQKIRPTAAPSGTLLAELAFLRDHYGSIVDRTKVPTTTIRLESQTLQALKSRDEASFHDELSVFLRAASDHPLQQLVIEGFTRTASLTEIAPWVVTNVLGPAAASGPEALESEALGERVRLLAFLRAEKIAERNENEASRKGRAVAELEPGAEMPSGYTEKGLRLRSVARTFFWLSSDEYFAAVKRRLENFHTQFDRYRFQKVWQDLWLYELMTSFIEIDPAPQHQSNPLQMQLTRLAGVLPLDRHNGTDGLDLFRKITQDLRSTLESEYPHLRLIVGDLPHISNNKAKGWPLRYQRALSRRWKSLEPGEPTLESPKIVELLGPVLSADVESQMSEGRMHNIDHAALAIRVFYRFTPDQLTKHLKDQSEEATVTELQEEREMRTALLAKVAASKEELLRLARAGEERNWRKLIPLRDQTLHWMNEYFEIVKPIDSLAGVAATVVQAAFFRDVSHQPTIFELEILVGRFAYFMERTEQYLRFTYGSQTPSEDGPEPTSP